MLKISFLFIFAIANMAHAQEPTCPEAVDKLAEMIRFAPQSPETEAWMNQVKNCIAKAARGEPIAVRDVPLNVADVRVLGVPAADADVYVLVSGLIPRCAKLNHLTLNSQFGLSVTARAYSCSLPDFQDVVPFVKELNLGRLPSGEFRVRYAVDEQSYRELLIKVP